MCDFSGITFQNACLLQRTSLLAVHSIPPERRTLCTKSRYYLSMRATRFRPCIDLHQGKVKQLVGSTLSQTVQTNFESTKSSSYYAELFRRDLLPGGHVIMLGSGNELAARSALGTYPGGLQIGGGINVKNAKDFLDAGASHVIITSYVFREGQVDWERLNELQNLVGKRRLVLDLSCKQREGKYYVCTDRWSKLTKFDLQKDSLNTLGKHCDELLIHAIDVEGRKAGIDVELLKVLAEAHVKVTYAGGVRNLNDMDLVDDVSKGKVDVTVGSALSIFGGKLKYKDVVMWQRKQERVLVRD